MSKVEDIIVREGKNLVWQNPRKDKNSIVKLTRISPRNGYNSIGKVHWDYVETPTESGYYHFYQIGDNYPGDFTLIAKKNQWYRLSDWCRVIDLVIHIYDKHGRLIPLIDAYTIRLYNDNIIIAVKRNDHLFDLNEHDIYIHFYRNYFYTTTEKDSQTPHIEYNGLTEDRSNKISGLLSLYSIAQSRKRGGFRLTCNGYYTEKIVLSDIVEGDTVEIHYDMSIRKVVDFELTELRTFKSSLDQINKYLLHPPKEEKNIIDYRDDIDIFICHREKKSGKIKGVYYHRNMEDSVRMVTHRDWAIPVPYVMSYIEHLDPNPDLSEFFIRVFVRDNGPDKALTSDCNMIRALYTLPDDKIIEAMVMVDSTVEEWTADNLERSPYTALMRSYRHEITPALVLDALGYNTSAKLLANPNINITKDPNGDYFKLTEGLYKLVTIFEYNENGLLLGWYTQEGMLKYYPRNKGCVFIEAIAGEGGDDLNIYFGKEPQQILPNTAYRFYIASVGLDIEKAKTRTTDWKDATGDDRIVITQDNEVYLDYNVDNEIACLWGDNKFLCYDTTLTDTDGLIDFAITTGFNHLNPIRVPPGKIDIWMNGYSLVEDIDYYINFPMVVIVNKRYANEGGKQNVTVRCTGFPIQHKHNLKRIAPREVGFIQYGELSVNNHFDFHDDRILRINANGGIFDPDTVPFDEGGKTNVKHFIKDGSPYAIETPYVSMSGSMGVNLYSAQVRDYNLATKVNQYLTFHANTTTPRLPPIIDDKYEVYSPFLSKVSMDLKYGRLRSLANTVNIQVVDKLMEPYKKYLTVDPCKRGFDKNFVNVHAHNQIYLLELNPRDIAFLERLNDIYLESKVDVSKFYKVRNGK